MFVQKNYLFVNSKKITENNLKYYNTINNIFLSNNRYKNRNKENVFDRLYNDNKLQEKKMNKLIKLYYNPLFKPSINTSYSYNKSHKKIKLKSKTSIKKIISNLQHILTMIRKE